MSGKIGRDVVTISPQKRGYIYEKYMRSRSGGRPSIIKTATGKKIQFDQYDKGIQMFGFVIKGDTVTEYKNWRQKLPLREIKKFLKKVRRAEKSTGRIISKMIIRNTGGYTKDARNYATQHGITLL
jgi:hypothetical protein